jgi:hypothetical protein
MKSAALTTNKHRPYMKPRLLIPVALASLATLAGGGVLLQQGVSHAAATWQSAMQAHGVEVTLASPLQWQLWPFGLKSGAVTLRSKTDGALLNSPAALLTFNPADIFTGRAGALHLENASLIYRRHNDGSSNWDALLAENDKAELRGIVLENATLDIWTPAAVKPLQVSINTLYWQDIGQSVMPLQADFLLSVQNSAQENLLLENTLHTEIHTAAGKTPQLRNMTLATTASSTGLPGTLLFNSNGNITLSPGGWQSDALRVTAEFKAPGVAGKIKAEAVTSLQSDWKSATLTLPKLSVKAGGQHWQTQGDLVARWDDKSLHAARLTVTYEATEKSASRRLDISELKLITAYGNGKRQATLSGKIGAGHVEVPVTAALTPASMDISTNITAYQLELADLHSWLGDPEARGQLDLDAELHVKGQTLADLQQGNGRLALRLQKAHLGAVSILPLLRERLQGYASLLPELATAPAGAEKGTAFNDLQITLALKQGVITTEKLYADMALARLDASGSYNSNSGLMDYRGKLILDSRLFTNSKNMELPLRCAGNLQEEQVDFIGGLETDCKVDEQVKQDLLARALMQRFRH